MNCPLCNSEQVRLFHEKVWFVDDGKVYRCVQCDVTFLYPMMDEAEERLFYQQYNEHVKKRGVAASGSSAELHEKSLAVARERHAAIGRMFAGVQSVLEVGAATGAFLQQLDVACRCAVEPARDNREFSKQFADCTYADIDEVPLEPKFDVICMFHVFEHIRQPGEFLRKCLERLRAPGGRIVIEVPNIADPLISLYDCAAFKDFYFQPMHPYVHSVASLRTIFQQAGLREQEVICYQRYGLVNHLNWLAKGKPGGNPDWQRILGEGQEYKAALARQGITDTLFYVAEI